MGVDSFSTEKFNEILTADVKGAKRCSFMGVTAHWLKILPCGTIIQMSAAIACHRFPGDLKLLNEEKKVLFVFFYRIAYSRLGSRDY